MTNRCKTQCGQLYCADCCDELDPGWRKPTPHKHAAIIKEWADGAVIQKEVEPGRWRSVPIPEWGQATNYRVKPTPKPLEDVAHDAFYASCDKEFGGHHWRAVAAAVVKAYKERQQ
jgi:hypothetical protein